MASIFLDANELFPIAASARVFGRGGGNEGVAIQPGVGNVTLDANIERVDLAQNSDGVSFGVNEAGLVIRASDASKLVTVPSLNQAADLRLADGNVTLRQIGAAEFEIEGADGGTQTVDTRAGTGIDVQLGPASSSTGGDGSGSRGNTLSGDVLVDGAPASAIPISASTLTVGDEAGGSLALADGRSRRFASDQFDNVEVAAADGASGSLSLAGGGTEIVTAGSRNTVQIGREGEGNLTVENGAQVSTLQFEVGRRGDGTATIRGSDSKVTASNDNGLFTGEFAFQAGFVRLAKKPESSADLDILDGGELEVRPGENVDRQTSGPGISIGEEIGSTADVTVAGQGSEIDIRQGTPFDQFGAFLAVGEGLGQGDLTIRDGGRVGLDGPVSTLTVSAAEPAQANDTSDTSAVAPSSLTIESGGRVAVTGETTGNVFLAPGEGGDATVRVRGDGSRLALEGTNGYSTIDVANAGSADLTIADGGRVEALYMGVGGDDVPPSGSYSDFNTGGTGRVTVDGPGSELALEGTSIYGIGGFLTVGRTGTGSLDVVNGGTVTIGTPQGRFPALEVGDSAIGEGTVTVDGPGSTISVSGGQGMPGDGGYAGYIAVGTNGGTGEMTVLNGAGVTNDPAGTTFVGNDGANSDGTLTVTGTDSTLDAGNRLVIAGTFDPDSDSIDLSGGGSGSVTVENGASLRAGEAEGDGETDIFVGTNGSLQVASGASLTGDVRTADGGQFTTGASPGLAIVRGDVEIGGETTFELDGLAEDQFDRIEASGDVTLGGDVTFDVGGEFRPEPGDNFTIVEADGGAALADDFSVATQGLPGERGIELEAEESTIVATVVDSGSEPDALA